MSAAVSWRADTVRLHELDPVAHVLRTDRFSHIIDGVAQHITVCGWSMPATARPATADDPVCATCNRSSVSPPDGQLTLDVMTTR